jgi:hypothetical protein
MEGGSMRLFLALALVAGMALIEVAPAAAAPPGSDQDVFAVGDAAVLGPVHVRGDVARVHARYSCDVGTHIWVSVKQSAAADIDHAVAAEDAGFGGVAAAWWDSHRGSFTCDGKRHVAWYTVDTVEEGTRGQLQSGWGYVQFCITTDEDLISIRQQWSRVVTNG